MKIKKTIKPNLENAGTETYVSHNIKNVNPENSCDYNCGAAWQGNDEINSGTNTTCDSVNKKEDAFIQEYYNKKSKNKKDN